MKLTFEQWVRKCMNTFYKETHMIDLGDIAKDNITGFKGTVVAVTRWLNGCNRIMIQPNSLDKDGKPIEPVCFDEQQLTLVTAKKYKHKPKTDPPGGPRPDPTRW